MTPQLGTTRRILQHLRALDRTALLAALEDTTSGRDDFELRALIEHALQRTPDVSQVADAGLNRCLRGWAGYFGADYSAARLHFEAAWREDGAWSSWAALGLCKVASDLGYWSRARDWGLVCLERARRENDVERQAEAAGAVGEVYLRAGHPKLAYELISLDSALLPPGSGHRDRLGNYLAVCLGRLGQFALAESMLWHNYFAARDHAPYSASFSRASLYVLSALSDDQTLFNRLEALGSPSLADGSAMAAAFVSCVRAYWCRPTRPSESDPTAALGHLESAASLFERHYPVESSWVSQLVEQVSGRPPRSVILETLRARPSPERAPELHHVLDSRYAAVSLADELAFPLLGSEALAANPWMGLRMFFI